MTAQAVEIKPESAAELTDKVIERSGQPLLACYQCRRCAAGCPVGEETGYVTPDRLIRMIALGDKEAALNNELVWKCVSCYTCGTRCPNNIQTARITETLKKMAKEEHLKPILPKVKVFHDEFVNSGVRWGRVNEMEFMGFYALKNFIKYAKSGKFSTIIDEIKEQARLGLTMFGKGRLHIGFQTAKGRKELKSLYAKSKKKM